MIRSIVAMFALVAVACGGGNKEATEPTPAPAAETAPAEAAPNPDSAPAPAEAPAQPKAEAGEEDVLAASFAFMQALAEAAKVDGDCKAKAAAMNQVIDENEGLIEQAKKYQGDEEMQKRWDAEFGQQAMELMTEMATVSLKDCMADPDIGAAMQRISGE